MSTESSRTSSGEHVVAFGGPDEGRAVSRHELARFAAGELDDERRRAVEAALASDPGRKAELDELEAERRAFQATMPFERFAARHEERQALAGPGGALGRWRTLWDRLRWPAGGLVLAGAAAALLVVGLPSEPSGGSSSSEGQIRLKGAARLGLFVRQGAQARLGADGEELAPGDQIQFVVKDTGHRSMALVGVDGKGVVTLYEAGELPSTTEKGAAAVGAERKPRVLEQSLILDDALGPERFYLVYSDEDPGALAERAKRAARVLVSSGADLRKAEQLPLDGDGAHQSSIHIVKVAR